MLLQERDERLEEEEKEGGGILEGGTYVACCAGKKAVIAESAAREARWDWSLGDVVGNLQQASTDSIEEKGGSQCQRCRRERKEMYQPGRGQLMPDELAGLTGG